MEYETLLTDIYYDPQNVAGYSSLMKLYKEATKKNPEIKLKQVRDWLKKQETYTLHKSVRKHFPRRKTIVSGIDDVWQVDLCDMSSLSRYNSGYKFLLTGIDVFSRYAFCRPLKNKTGMEVLKALKSIFDTENRAPRKINCDKGSEFYNRHVKGFLDKHNIKLYSVSSVTKSSLIERFNRSLKSRMYKYFTSKNTRKYIDILQHLISSYNSSKHRITGLPPNQVSKANESELWKKLYQSEFPKSANFRFDVGDSVRISKLKKTFDKGYIPSWTQETFVVTERRATKPVTYKLREESGENLIGIFYQEELQAIGRPTADHLYQVDVLRTRKSKGTTQYFVHYRGWPNKYDEWIDKKQMARI